MIKPYNLTHLVLLLAIAACSSSDSDSDSDGSRDADRASLPPLITYPADGATVSGLTEVRVDIDDAAAFERLSLLVNGIEVATDSEAPYTFAWNPYFDSETSDASLLVRASTDDGETLRSDPLSVRIEQPQDLSVIALQDLPEDNPDLAFPYGTTDLVISWNSVTGADEYEYQIGDAEPTLTAATEARFSLAEGSNALRIRAADEDRWGPWVSLPAITVLAPQSPSITSTINEDGSITVTPSLDSSASFKSVSLVVDDEVVATSGESPFTFTWDPYYWGVQTTTRYRVQAELDDGRIFQSEDSVVDTEETQLTDRITVRLPEGAPNYMGIDTLNVSWTSVEGASAYEYQLNGVTGTAEQTSTTLTELAPGNYQLRVMAVDASGRKGVWSPNAAFEVQLPSAPKFASPQPSATLSDVSSVDVEWLEVAGAGSYQYRTDEAWVDIQGTVVAIPALSIGYYGVEVRSIDALGRPGPSNTIHFQVAPPELPNVYSPNVEWNGEQFEVTLAWEAQGEGNRYEVAWGENPAPHDITTNSLKILVGATGEYSWRFKRTNSVGHQTEWVMQPKVPVGIFRTQLGGSRNDFGGTLFRSIQGGYIVIAETYSRELEPSISNDSAPWVIRLSETGSIVGDLVLTPPERVTDTYEDTDGSIYLSGYDFSSKKGFIYKLSKELEITWKKSYAATDSVERFDLTALTKWNSSIIAAGATWKTEGSFSSRDKYELLSISPADGDLLNSKEISSVESLPLIGANKLGVSPSGELFLAGMVNSGGNDLHFGLAFVSYLNSDLESRTAWISPQYSFVNVGDWKFTTSGNLAVIGQSHSDGNTTVILNGSDLSQVALNLNEHRDSYYPSGSGFDRNDSGGVIALLQDGSQYPMVVVEYGEELFEMDRRNISEERGYIIPGAVLRNPDNSLTILFSQGQSGSDNYDIIIKRLVLLNE